MKDPLATSAWSRPQTVAGFSKSAPNATLMQFAEAELRRAPGGRALDIGCGAGRNAIPLAGQGWHVVGIDLSLPMVYAAVRRAAEAGYPDRFVGVLAPMGPLPVATASCDLIVAHGIWNLARSAVEFRGGVQEAARVAAPGAGLFVFTFSRTTLPLDAMPAHGESFVFTQFSGEPQCFLTEEQLVTELGAVGFDLDPSIPLRELNKPRPGNLCQGGPPLIYEGAFRRRA